MRLQRHSLLTFFLALAVFLSMLQYSGLVWRKAFETITDSHPVGVQKVDCWFQIEADWPVTECYYVHVPQNHQNMQGGTVSFPLLVFRSRRFVTFESPVLHLGGGGPGSPVYMDSTETVRSLWEYHDAFSLDLGRDLFIIDPRGTGMARPLLTCNTFVDNEVERLGRNLDVVQYWKLIDQDYLHCYHQFRKQGIDLSAFNSLVIAQDIELLRKLTHTDKWLLYGVSYAATYAQVIANIYPDSVEAMILDSATFPNLKPHHRLVSYTMAPYEKLYNYCNVVPDCETPIDNVQKRIWALHKALTTAPIQLDLPHPYEDDTVVTVSLNGDRFIAALLEGIYDIEIFHDLPRIIQELENRNSDSLLPYIQAHVTYLLDRSYGDVSESAHHCYETVPFTDKASMREQARQLPQGYIRDTTLLGIDWPDHCDKMGTGTPDPRVAQLNPIAVPTLFLHGEFDTVTLLDDVYDQIDHFANSQVIVYPVSHSVMTADDCAELVASRFVAQPGELPVDESCF